MVSVHAWDQLHLPDLVRGGLHVAHQAQLQLKLSRLLQEVAVGDVGMMFLLFCDHQVCHALGTCQGADARGFWVHDHTDIQDF